MREHVKAADGRTISYSKYGSGPPLVLVHGGFSDDISNWEFVAPMLERHFTVYAIARRGRGQTEEAADRTVQDEGKDVIAVMNTVREPVFLLGHSYGAHCSLAAAALVPNRIRKLVLYEPPRTDVISREQLSRLEDLASTGAWDDFSTMFFKDVLLVPETDVQQLRSSAGWAPILEDARPSLGDIQALSSYEFNAARFTHIDCPVLLQVGTESPRHLYLTDALAAVLPHATIQELPGQAHEGMTTAPEMYAEAVTGFLLKDSIRKPTA